MWNDGKFHLLHLHSRAGSVFSFTQSRSGSSDGTRMGRGIEALPFRKPTTTLDAASVRVVGPAPEGGGGGVGVRPTDPPLHRKVRGGGVIQSGSTQSKRDDDDALARLFSLVCKRSVFVKLLLYAVRIQRKTRVEWTVG